MIHNIFAEFKENRTQIEMSTTEMQLLLNRYQGNIYLYGAGSSGIAFFYILKKINIVPKAFLDGDSKKNGTCLEGIPVFTMDAIPEDSRKESLVIVCINTDGKRYCKSFDDALRIGGHHGVYKNLGERGYANIIDYTFFRHCFSVFCNERYNAPSCSDVDLMLQHEKEIECVYELLADEKSKDIYEKIVRFRMIDDTIDIPTLDQDQQYFEKEFWDGSENGVFFDCGAFNGNSFLNFKKLSKNRFEGYYGLEPDASNWKTLLQVYEQCSPEEKQKMHLFKLALWSSKEQKRLYELNGPGSFLTENENGTVIDTTTVDDVLQGERITLLKMNIEGSEKEALFGAKQTISTWKPTLAIAGYHRTDDLWRIPLQIKSYRNDYKLYLRSYMNHISFVYYAV